MDFRELFTSLEGRINRSKYWTGALILLGIWFVVDLLLGSTTLGSFLLVLLTLALFYPGYAVAAKRFQDRDKPGRMAVYGLLPVALAALLYAFGFTGNLGEPNAIGWICILIYWAVGLWFLIELGILKGTPGPNRFGGDPLAAIY
jgi:uncharacterized membrane protein YhaH (DUF805 family)